MEDKELVTALNMTNHKIRVNTLNILYYSTRLYAYRVLGWSEDAINDEYWEIRLEAYRNLGFTEKAYDDSCREIRLEAYRKLGFTEKAFDDEYEEIRIEAYHILGWDSAKDEMNRITKADVVMYDALKSKSEKELKYMVSVELLKRL